MLNNFGIRRKGSNLPSIPRHRLHFEYKEAGRIHNQEYGCAKCGYYLCKNRQKPIGPFINENSAHRVLLKLNIVNI